MVHGLGNALLERLPYDEGNQPRATTFLDYALPNSAVVPEIRLESRGIRLLETDPRAALEGADAWPVCGVGELGALPVPSAVAAAVEDALGLLEILTVLPIDEGGLPASPTSGG